MNLVDLVDQLSLEAGIHGGQITTVQGSITSQRRRLKGWINGAWKRIQLRHLRDWRFLQARGNCPLAAGQTTVIPPEQVAGQVHNYVEDRFRISKAPEPLSRSGPLQWLEPEEVDDILNWNPIQGGQGSFVGTLDGHNELIVLPACDVPQTLWYTYRRNPQVLVEDTDEPWMPAAFHELIVWEALIDYGGLESAPEAVSRGRLHAGELWAALDDDQLPMVRVAGFGG